MQGAHFAVGLPLLNWYLPLVEQLGNAAWRLPVRSQRDVKVMRGVYQRLREVEVGDGGKRSCMGRMDGDFW